LGADKQAKAAGYRVGIMQRKGKSSKVNDLRGKQKKKNGAKYEKRAKSLRLNPKLRILTSEKCGRSGNGSAPSHDPIGGLFGRRIEGGHKELIRKRFKSNRSVESETAGGETTPYFGLGKTLGGWSKRPGLGIGKRTSLLPKVSKPFYLRSKDRRIGSICSGEGRGKR